MSNLNPSLDYREKDYTTLNHKLLYLDFIDKNYEYELVPVEPDIAYVNQGNFIGLLDAMMVEPKLFMTAMYLNGINNPVDFDGKPFMMKRPVNPPIPNR